MSNQKATSTKFYGITDAQIQEIGTYLVNRPFREVEQYINILRNLPTVLLQDEAKAVTPVNDPSQLEIEFPTPGEDTPPESVKISE